MNGFAIAKLREGRYSRTMPQIAYELLLCSGHLCHGTQMEYVSTFVFVYLKLLCHGNHGGLATSDLVPQNLQVGTQAKSVVETAHLSVGPTYSLPYSIHLAPGTFGLLIHEPQTNYYSTSTVGRSTSRT